MNQKEQATDLLMEMARQIAELRRVNFDLDNLIFAVANRSDRSVDAENLDELREVCRAMQMSLRDLALQMSMGDSEASSIVASGWREMPVSGRQIATDGPKPSSRRPQVKR